MSQTDTMTAARLFLRSLNLVLKSARLYGFEHVRTAAQLGATFRELRNALPAGGNAGDLVLGVAGDQLLLNGVPIEATPAERGFAQLLSAAGVVGVQFSSGTTLEDFGRFVRAFATGSAKAADLAEQLKRQLGKGSGSSIRINEVRFVAEDAALGEARVAAQLTARTLGIEAERLKDWLSDPQKLLQLIAAAEGAATSHGVQAAPAAAAPSPGPLREEDVVGLLRLLGQLGEVSRQPNATLKQAPLEQLRGLPAHSQASVREALAGLAAAAPADRPDAPLLLRLAEHLAVRYAMERYERGEVKVNAVRQLLDRMSNEVQTLHKILAAHEEKMGRVGLLVESHADILDRQFWASVPVTGKRAVLLSPDAWCIPPRNVRQFITELLDQGDVETAKSILQNYAGCVFHDDPQARRKVAVGLSELVALYAGADSRLLEAVVAQLGRQLKAEQDPELVGLLSAAFVRFSQEAATRHTYPAMEQALAALERVQSARPAFAQDLRQRIGVETRLPEFIEESLRAPRAPQGLLNFLRRVPQAAQQLAARFGRCTRRAECDRLAELAAGLGPEGAGHLRETLRARPAAEAVVAVGLLSRLDLPALEELLPLRLPDWHRSYHDLVVRQIASAGGSGRGRLLVSLFDALHRLALPEALDEIGMSGDSAAASRLMRLAEGGLPHSADPYLRAKAVEALGRLRAQEAAKFLRHLLEARHLWRWLHPRELRVVAAQALQKIDPDWLRGFLPHSGLTAAELSVAPLDPASNVPWTRQRRYARFDLPRPLEAVASTLRGDYRLTTRRLGLGGGLASCESQLSAGTLANLKLQSGLRSVRAEVLVRDVPGQHLGFEIVEIDLQERSKLRRLLAGLGTPPSS